MPKTQQKRKSKTRLERTRDRNMASSVQYRRGPEAGMLGYAVASKEGVAKNVGSNLSSGIRGTSSAPVGGRRTVGQLESLVGQARKKIKKSRNNG